MTVMALVCACAASTSSADQRFQFPSPSATADPACQSPDDTSVSDLHCFCAGGSCPADLRAALQTVTAQCADGSCTAIRSDDDCGQVRIIVGNGSAHRTYIYRISDGTLVGAEHFLECCRARDIITSGTAPCPIVTACLLTGQLANSQSKLPPCSVDARAAPPTSDREEKP